MIAVRQLEVETIGAVTVQVFLGKSCTNYGRNSSGSCGQKTIAVAAEIINRYTKKAVPTYEVNTRVKCRI